MRNEGILHRVKEKRDMLEIIKRSQTNWIGHILRRNRLLKYVIVEEIEGRIKVTGRRGRRRKQLLNDFK